MGNRNIVGIHFPGNTFHIFGMTPSGDVLINNVFKKKETFQKTIQQLPTSLIGISERPGAQYWARHAQACGHEVRIIPSQYLSALIRRNRRHKNTALSCYYAVQRPDIAVIPVSAKEIDETLS